MPVKRHAWSRKARHNHKFEGKDHHNDLATNKDKYQCDQDIASQEIKTTEYELIKAIV